MYEEFNKYPEIREDFYENGQKKSEIWYLNGELHREDGPAYQFWYKNGQKQYESWYLNNKRHREGGLAYQRWYENGQKKFEGWFLNDKRYTKEEWINELKEIGSEHYEEQKMLYDMEKYNI